MLPEVSIPRMEHALRADRHTMMRYTTDMQRPGDAPPPRKSGGPRSCFKKNGGPKTAFATAKLAERAIPRTSTGLRPYRCETHGWHLGH